MGSSCPKTVVTGFPACEERRWQGDDEDDPQWALEVINDEGTSTVWDALFDTDEEAFAAFEITVEEEGMEAFFDRGNVIPFPRRH